MDVKIYTNGTYETNTMINWLDHVGVKFRKRKVEHESEFTVKDVDNNFLEILNKNNIKYFL